MDAPSFEGIGNRRSFDWMRRWIENPKSLRPSARMPKLFHGAGAPEQALAAAAYLASLKTGGEVALPEPPPWKSLTPPPAEGPAGEAKPLFEKLHCVACHLPPDAKEADPDKIPLSHVAEKFPSGRLEEFLRQPNAHYQWIRMPNFRLSKAEAGELAGYLTGLAAKPSPVESPADAALLEKGREVVQTSGCLSCHASTLVNRASAPAWKSLAGDAWKRGCLAGEESASGKAPWHSLSEEAAAGLRGFGATDRSSLAHYEPAEFTSRQTRLLRCTACHGQFEGFPAFDVLGGKLQPEWAEAFIGGKIPYKPRAEKHPKGEVWLEARMPAFPGPMRPRSPPVWHRAAGIPRNLPLRLLRWRTPPSWVASCLGNPTASRASRAMQ